jgi:hypothetical protein
MLKEDTTFKDQANENDKKRNKMSIIVNNKSEFEIDDEESLKNPNI